MEEKMKLDKNKKNILVVFGGKSVEHDISIITAVQVMHALDNARFNIIPVYIDKKSKWLTSDKFFDISTFSSSQNVNGLEVTISLNNKSLYSVKKNKNKLLCKLDFVFLVMHGGCGENGAFQGLLDVAGIPYSSAGVLGSAIAMDKFVTKAVCSYLDISTPKCVPLFLEDNQKSFSKTLAKISNLSFPLIVKPASLGSSIGITFCKNKKTLKDAISFAFMFDSVVLVEEVVPNLRELNMSFLGDSNFVENSALEEVTSKQNFLSFENKYLGSSSGKGIERTERKENVEIDNIVKEQIEEYGKKLFKYLDLKGCVRIDYLLDSKTNKLYVNEINSIPGSMANYLWKGKYSFKALLNKMYDYAVQDFEQNNKKIKYFSSSILRQFAPSSKIIINK